MVNGIFFSCLFWGGDHTQSGLLLALYSGSLLEKFRESQGMPGIKFKQAHAMQAPSPWCCFSGLLTSTSEQGLLEWTVAVSQSGLERTAEMHATSSLFMVSP